MPPAIYTYRFQREGAEKCPLAASSLLWRAEPPPGSSGDGGPAASALLNNPTALAVDASGNHMVTDSGNNRVRKVSASGIITTIAGNGTSGFSGDGGLGINAKIQHPRVLAADVAGNVYFADVLNNRIARLLPTE